MVFCLTIIANKLSYAAEQAFNMEVSVARKNRSKKAGKGHKSSPVDGNSIKTKKGGISDFDLGRPAKQQRPKKTGR